MKDALFAVYRLLIRANPLSKLIKTRCCLDQIYRYYANIVFSISRKLNIAGKGIYEFGSCLTGVSDVVAILGGGRTPVVLHLRFDSSGQRRYLDASCEG